MDENARHAEFQVELGDEGLVRIETGGLKIVTQYLADKEAKPSYMGPANVFFAAILA